MSRKSPVDFQATLELRDAYKEIVDFVENGLAFETLKEELSLSAFSLYKNLRRHKYEHDFIYKIAKEKIVAITVINYINSQHKLNQEHTRSLGFEPAHEVCFPIDPEFKELIRLDASGFIDSSYIKKVRRKISSEYSAAIAILDAPRPQNSEQSKRVEKDFKALIESCNSPKKIFSSRRKMKKFGVIVDKDQQKKEEYKPKKYKRSEYNLYSSPAWKKYYAKFPSFKKLNQTLIAALQERHIPPEIVKTMNFYDFQELLYRTFRKPGKDYAVFGEAKLKNRVMEIMKNPANEKAVRDYMTTKGFGKKDIDEKVLEMKERGVTGSLFALHHRTAVVNAGILTQYHKANDPDNLVLVSSEMHMFIHHNDHITEDGIFYNKIVFPPKDVLLSFTDIWQTEYNGKINEAEKEAVQETKAKILINKEKTLQQKAPQNVFKPNQKRINSFSKFRKTGGKGR